MQWDLKKLSFIKVPEQVCDLSSKTMVQVPAWVVWFHHDPPAFAPTPTPCPPPPSSARIFSLSRSFFWPQIKPRTLNSSHKFPQVWFPLLYPALPPPILPLIPPPPSLAFSSAENPFPTFFSGTLKNTHLRSQLKVHFLRASLHPTPTTSIPYERSLHTLCIVFP